MSSISRELTNRIRAIGSELGNMACSPEDLQTKIQLTNHYIQDSANHVFDLRQMMKE